MKRKLQKVDAENSLINVIKIKENPAIEKIESWDSEDEEDDSEEENDSEEESDSEEEEGDSEMSDEAPEEDERFKKAPTEKGAGAAPPDAKKPRLSKSNLYKPPTNEEMQELKETETLFQSSLFRMQISELLNEVKLKEKHKKLSQEYVKDLQKVLLGLKSQPERVVDQQKIFKKVKVPMIQRPFSVQGRFKFEPPKSVTLIGSSSIGSACRPDVNIDLALEIPKECFNAKDFRNQRYLRKKAQYLACLVLQLNKSPLVEEMQYSHHHCGHLSPILVITPKGKLGKHAKVHLHLYPEDGSFKLNRFHIAKGNIQSKWYLGGENEDKEEDKNDAETPAEATPYYNSTVLSDLTRMELHDTLHSSLENASGLVDGLILLKVWLRQRELNFVNGGFSNFLITAFVVHLLKKRKLNVLMSSYQVLRNVLFNLSQANWGTEGISLCEKSSESDPHMPGMEEFHKYFDVVFVDSSGYLNMAAFLTSETFDRVKHEAKNSVDQLETLGSDGFDALFMNPCPFMRKFDQVFHITDLAKLQECVDSHDLKSRVMDLGGDFVHAAAPSLLRLLKQGLGNRVTVMQLQPSPLKTWPCSEEPPEFTHLEKLTVGLLLDPQNAGNVVVKGPPADSSEANAFRKFWGDKSELRRFQDGSILEAVVWQAKTISQKRNVISRIFRYIASLHFKMDTKSIISIGPQLDFLLQFHASNSQKSKYGTGEEQHIGLIKIYDDLAKQLRKLNDLPLTIHSVQATDPALCYTKVFPALKPLDDEPVKLQGARQVPQSDQPCPLYNPSMSVQCTLEQSGKWPDDVQAVRRLKAAFHITLAQGLKEQFGLLAHPYPTHVSVLKNDMVFNVEIVYLKEIGLLREEKTSDGMVKIVDNEEARQLERRVVMKPKLASAIRGIQSVHASFCSAVRLLKRWVSAQMLSQFFNEEVLELIAAHVYIQPAPFTAPSSPLVGFLRMLHLLASFDWKLFPLIVNLNQELTKADYVEIQTNFTKQRPALPLMFIANPYDKLKSVWTKGQCSAPILQRLTLLAKQCLDLIQSQLESVETDVDFKQAFRPPLDSFDVQIHLKTMQMSKCHQAVDVDKSLPVPFFQPIDGEQQKETLRSSIPVVDYDPPALYLQELQDAFGDLAVFFHDPLGGSVIGVLWKPGVFQPHDFKVANANARMPKLTEKSVKLVPNVDAILEDFKLMGQGLVKQIVVKDQ